MSDIITVTNLSKRYDITKSRGGYVAMRDVLAETIKHPLKAFAPKDVNETFWALKDVSFSVEKGEALGIIGSNGSGKSTLLKILTKITPPTHGEITMRGKAASLLEVGTGFHPELSGRENIFLNGAILGMTKKEIKSKFDEIVDFSGVEKFIDTPVKHYSSGMYVRLAFAVAAHLEPDILLVDEVLAVGDAAFQKKCLGKMDDVIKTDGRTILFVSHNMTAIQNLCTRCAYLDHGQLKAIGETKQILDSYLKSTLETGFSLKDRHDRRYKTPLKLTSFHFEHAGKRVNHLQSAKDYDFCFTYDSSDGKPLTDVALWADISREDGAPIFHINTSYTAQNFKRLPPHGVIKCRVKRLPLVSGYYQFSVVIRSSDKLDIVRQAGSFEVQPGKYFGHLLAQEFGQVFVDQDWSLT